MRLSVVVTCVNYGDILAWTLPSYRSQINRLVVVTTPDDARTRQVCDYYHVRCAPTDVFRLDELGNVAPNAFSKGRGINHGLECLLEQEPTEEDWFLHLDADIVLPPRAQELLHTADLDPRCVYGVDRLNCQNFEDYLDHLSYPESQHQYQIFVHLDRFPISARVARLDHGGDGYLPIGYFQLWNPAGSGIRSYPTLHRTAARTDMQFALQWPRPRRQLIPEFAVIHLESEPALHGTNWGGRVTKLFEPAKMRWVPRHAPPGSDAPTPAFERDAVETPAVQTAAVEDERRKPKKPKKHKKKHHHHPPGYCPPGEPQ